MYLGNENVASKWLCFRNIYKKKLVAVTGTAKVFVV